MLPHEYDYWSQVVDERRAEEAVRAEEAYRALVDRIEKTKANREASERAQRDLTDKQKAHAQRVLKRRKHG